MHPTVTINQAIDRLNTLIQEAFAQLPPGAQLRAGSSSGAVECKGGVAGGDTGQVYAQRDYEIVHPDTWPADQIIDILDRYWQERGYTLVRDDRTQTLPAALLRRDPHDHTEIGIQVYHRTGGHIDAYLGGNTPCVWEHGTPPADA